MIRKYLLVLSVFCFSLMSNIILAQNSSVLSQGTWVKLSIPETGVYKLSYDDLQSMGIDVASLDPDKIQIFGNGGGMLPQPNDSIRPVDLQEIKIEVATQLAGDFNPGDFIVFYAEGPDCLRYNSDLNKFDYQNHLFSELNYYYLTGNQNTGTRIEQAAPAIVGLPLRSGYMVHVHEQELKNILHSGREWYGESFDLDITKTITTPLENITQDSEIKVSSTVMSSSVEPSSFDIHLNGMTLGTHNVAANPSGTYSRKGITESNSFLLNKSLIDDSPLALTYTFNKSSGIGYLDKFLIEAEVDLIYNGIPLMFYTGDLTKSGNRTISISNCPEGLVLWDTTDPAMPESISFSQNVDIVTFNVSSTIGSLVLFDPETIDLKPEGSSLENQNLRGISGIDLLIVSPDEYYSSAMQIAELREQEGLTVTLASPEQIYNEFSSGKPDITAIRDFAKHLYDNAGLKYLLLFGKGTYDPKDILGSGYSKIPIYESRNSLSPLATYGSDDYLGFLEDGEGDWLENSSNDHTLDIGVGRIPVASIDEANQYVEKLVNYKKKAAIGSWRQDVVFVAEDGDANIHQRDAERLSTLIDTTYANFNTQKIYVDAYPIEVNPGSKRVPDANQAIYQAINQGALIVNYTGHGSETQWAKTKIFDKKVIDSLKNDRFLPLFVTATCEFGRHDDTGTRSGGETLLLGNKTGGVATITTARPVFASSNYQLNLAFYNSVFERVNGEYKRLGDIFIDTKNNSLNGVLNRNFSLLGDPSMRLTYGNQFITIDSLNSQKLEEGDTLRPLEELIFSGSIRKANNSIDNAFTGQLEVELLDRAQLTQTLGNQGATPFTYKVRDNILFKGAATINNGEFSFTTVLPKDISYSLSSARLVLYASKSDSSNDASGANIDLLIGSSSATPIVDTTPPEVEIFFGDTTYQTGQIVNPNTLLILKLFDENGINTSNRQIGHSITYSLDDKDSEILNEYYSTVPNSYSEGWVYFNLPQMTPGEHTIRATAWDTSNNSTTEEVNFIVSEDGEIVISDLSVYPNPFINNTNFTFSHNLSGNEIEVTLEIISTSGQKMYSEVRSYQSAPAVIDDWNWDGRNSSGGKLNAGIYIYGIYIRSINTNLAQNQFSRLFITN